MRMADEKPSEWAMDGFGFSFPFLTRLPKFRLQIQFQLARQAALTPSAPFNVVTLYIYIYSLPYEGGYQTCCYCYCCCYFIHSNPLFLFLHLFLSLFLAHPPIYLTFESGCPFQPVLTVQSYHFYFTLRAIVIHIHTIFQLIYVYTNTHINQFMLCISLGYTFPFSLSFHFLQLPYTTLTLDHFIRFSTYTHTYTFPCMKITFFLFFFYFIFSVHTVFDWGCSLLSYQLKSYIMNSRKNKMIIYIHWSLYICQKIKIKKRGKRLLGQWLLKIKNIQTAIRY